MHWVISKSFRIWVAVPILTVIRHILKISVGLVSMVLDHPENRSTNSQHPRLFLYNMPWLADRTDRREQPHHKDLGLKYSQKGNHNTNWQTMIRWGYCAELTGRFRYHQSEINRLNRSCKWFRLLKLWHTKAVQQHNPHKICRRLFDKLDTLKQTWPQIYMVRAHVGPGPKLKKNVNKFI